MQTKPKILPVGELASIVLASRGAAAYLAYIVQPRDASEVMAEIAAEIVSLDGTVEVATIRSPSAALLVHEFSERRKEVLLIGAETYEASDWRLLDIRRSSLPKGVIIFITTAAGFATLMRSAPNLASWLGGFVFEHEDPAARAEKMKGDRLAALRAWAGKTDEDVIQEGRRGILPRDPEYGEWLALLGRGDLL